MIPPPGPPDSLHARAAQGWLELGNHVEATAELEKVTPELQMHPDMLMVRWQIQAAEKNWQAALETASDLTHVVPEHPFGWVHRSFCLHELKRTAEARDNLLPVVDRFPDDAIMRYNLACYECQLGRLEQAKQWLEKAFRLGEAMKIRLMALDDPDLKPLWKHIETIQ